VVYQYAKMPLGDDDEEAVWILPLSLVFQFGGELVKGFAFELPPQQGLFDSGLVASSLVLATLGSMANPFYPEFLREKGWTTPAHRKVQQYDLLFGTVVVLFLAVAVWAIGAEVLLFGKQGVSEAADIADALAVAIAGRPLVAVFVAAAAVQGIGQAIGEIF
jgi:hypothetical protein